MTIQNPSGDEAGLTLHLPRILCLHGGGTNARIFRMQCRVLERFLRSTFRFVYAEAPFAAQPGSDVTSVYKDHGPFKAWLRCTAADPDRSAQEVVKKINLSIATTMYDDDMRGATGEWVALLGFSQGAKVAASILYAQQTLQQRLGERAATRPHFRFAVLMAGRGPLVWLLPETSSGPGSIPMGLVDAACPSMLESEPELPNDSTEHMLRLPTLHVHGLRDPGLSLHRRLLRSYCQPDSISLVEWEGEHRVPLKTKDVTAVVDQIYALARDTGVLDSWC
ncbi:serine hydrolase FSH [Aspergillus foveolatus]|uniref:serine hydrolase FSH n=1 Tax=Aspergillus foveolatus TaxID=210207 RepID=UPI003CCD14DB